MADPVSIIGIVIASLKLGDQICRYCASFKDAPRYAEDLVAQVAAVGEVLRLLRNHLEREQAKGSERFSNTSALFFSANGCHERLEQIHKFLAPLVSGTGALKFWRRLRWPLDRDNAADAVAGLHRYSQIFHFAVNLDGL